MSRFYVPPENIGEDVIRVGEKEAHHILDVMRLKESDSIVVFDGTGKEYTGFIKEAKTKSLVVEIISTKTPKRTARPDITLAQAIPKKAKIDSIIEKATELGVNSIIPIISERTVVKITEEKAGARLERWRNIAISAAKQCGRSDVPEVCDIRKFYFAVDGIDQYDLSMLACLSQETTSIRDVISDFKGGKIILFIGPEGDFTSEEIEMAKNANCKLVSLGPLVLKADTAPIAALSMLQYEFSK